MSDQTRYFEAHRGVMTRFLPPTYDKVLEVGCATGRFSQLLPLASEIWGVEPDKKAAELARNRMHTVLCGTYEQVAQDLPENHFDLLICNDVMEHMSDPEAFLHVVRAKLKPDAVLVGSLPNVLHITALAKLLALRDWRYSESGILDRTHLRFFTPKSMRRMLEECGLELQMLNGIGSVIRHGLDRPGNPLSPLKSLLFRAGAASVAIASLGFYWDTQYPQFGFRAVFKSRR